MIDFVMHRGVVHGRTIELAEELGLPDGAEVTVAVRPAAGAEVTAPGEGLRRAFGAWADDAEGLGEYLRRNRQQRKIERPETASQPFQSEQRSCERDSSII